MISTASWKSFWPSFMKTSCSLRISKFLQTVLTSLGSRCLSRLALEKSGFGQRPLHHGAILGGPHQVKPLAKEHVAVANGERVDVADLEIIDMRIGRTLQGDLRSLLTGSAGAGHG